MGSAASRRTSKGDGKKKTKKNKAKSKKELKKEIPKEELRQEELREDDIHIEINKEAIRTNKLKNDKVMVAALDFGTTYSAYAFSLRSSPNNILMNKNWGSGVGFESFKAPTCVLTKPNGKSIVCVC